MVVVALGEGHGHARLQARREGVDRVDVQRRPRRGRGEHPVLLAEHQHLGFGLLDLLE